MWQPTTRSLVASTSSFMSVFSSRPLMVPFMGRNLQGRGATHAACQQLARAMHAHSSLLLVCMQTSPRKQHEAAAQARPTNMHPPRPSLAGEHVNWARKL